MRLLITGASGFVGQALTRALAGSDFLVRAAARYPAAIPSLAYIEPAYLPDLASGPDWTPLLQDIDAVIHLAGIAHAGAGIADDVYDRVNRAVTETLAQACATRNIRMIFISSIRAQTGPAADHILTEHDTPRPTDAYGRSKLAAEDAVRRSGASFVILRPVVMYGLGVKGNIATVLRLAKTSLPLPFADFHEKRSLLAVNNLVAAIRHALAEPSMQGETFIVADNEPVSLAEIIAMMRAAQNRKPHLFSLPPDFFAACLRLIGRGDIWERIGGSLVADAAKLRATGWRPAVNTLDGLAAMVQAASPRKSGTASRSTP
ncbi:MAG: NAD-dependent epimerase/dehydratase family protein [Pseudorhodoplanes sp.]|jgi:UDP-glucose 4-epimerase|nr:NAD-dependent epimerase/dehydratase family protein [Pseudorhodoplanes sp.]